MEKEKHPITEFRFREFMKCDDDWLARLETTEDEIMKVNCALWS